MRSVHQDDRSAGLAWLDSYLGLDGGLWDRGDMVRGHGEALRHGLQCWGPHGVLRDSGHCSETSCKETAILYLH